MLKDVLNKYAISNPARFHMPGHKGKLCANDITELDFSDNLHAPTGEILNLQRKCAKKYGARSAHILVNGSSAGICAFLCALSFKLGRPPRIAVGRDCHKSFFSGAYFADAEVFGILPESSPFGVVTANAVKDALISAKEKPDAVFITSPNYYGMCADTEAIYRITREMGIYLFVDCAHGAHFPFSDELPPLPHADVFVVSTHKTLPSLNQTGLLLCCCDMDTELSLALDMLQTTSPSYPLMLSVEQALECDFSSHTKRIMRFRTELSEHGIKCAKKPSSAAYSDITRIVLLCDGVAKDGFSLGKTLQAHGIYAEMSDLLCTVLITSPFDDDEWYTRLLSVLDSLECRETPPVLPQISGYTRCYTSIRSAMLCNHTKVMLSDAVGKRAANPVGVYPPGTAVIFPNEVITEDAVKALLAYQKAGGTLFGTDNGKIAVAE